MQHSSRGSRCANPKASGAERHWLTLFRRRGWILVCALGTTLLLLPGSAQAEPTQQELRAKIDRLANKAEVITEKYNGQRLELKQTKKQANKAERRSKQMHEQLRKAHAELAEFAVERYKTGDASGRSWAMVTAGSPQEFVNQVAMISHLSRHKAERLRELRGVVSRSDHNEKEAKRSAAKVRKLTKELRKKKENIEELVAEAESKLEELQAEARASRNDRVAVPSDLGPGAASRATEIALAQRGDPYVWGAAGPDSFDCSGLVVYAYGKVGIDLPHYTGELWNSGQHVSRSELRVGDLVFFYSDRHHVGIYIGDGQMVHAPNSTTVVKVDSIDSRPYAGAVRIVS